MRWNTALAASTVVVYCNEMQEVIKMTHNNECRDADALTNLQHNSQTHTPLHTYIYIHQQIYRAPKIVKQIRGAGIG